MIEVNVIEIESAEKIRIETEKAIIRKENEQIKQAQIDKEKLEKDIIYIAEQIKNKIKLASEQGSGCIHYTFYTSQKYDNMEIKEKIIPVLKKIFENAGYQVSEYSEYSNSWTYRSGKLGYIFINW